MAENLPLTQAGNTRVAPSHDIQSLQLLEDSRRLAGGPTFH